jgi:hypothetical protein
MKLSDGERVWSVINVGAPDVRALFTRAPEARDYGGEDREGRIARRQASWRPTTLSGGPALAAADWAVFGSLPLLGLRTQANR